ncbi:MAG: hypothetical protein AAFW46_12680 [Pseudomonadota bacterium]
MIGLTALALLVELAGWAGPDGAFILWAFVAIVVASSAAGRDLRPAALRRSLLGSAPVETAPPPQTAPAIGASIAVGWVSSATLLGLGGALFVSGLDGFAFLTGLLAGFVLLASAIAPALRASGATSATAFLGRRYGSEVETLAALVAAVATLGLLGAQLSVAGIVLARFLHLPFGLGVALGALMVAAAAAGPRPRSGGYVAAGLAGLAVAYLGPAIWIALGEGHPPIPQASYLFALDEIGRIEQGLAASDTPPPAPHLVFGGLFDPLSLLLAALAFALGVAAQPHLLRASIAAPEAGAARWGLVWGFGLILALTLAAPAYAAYAKLSLHRLFEDGPASVLAAPDWLYRWSYLGESAVMATACDRPAFDEAALASACGGAQAVFGFDALRLDPDMAVLAAPEIVGAPLALTGLLGAGALAAALASAERAVRALGSSFAREIFVRRIRIGASITEERAAAAWAVPAILLGAGWWAMGRPADLLTQIAWAFSLSAGGLFPALIFGIWWRRAGTAAAAAAILLGTGATLFYQVGATVGLDGLPGSGDEIDWFGVHHLAAGALGAAIGGAALVGVSLALPDRARSTTAPRAPGRR